MSGGGRWERLKAKLEMEEADSRLHRQVNDWVDEAVREFEKNGGLEHVKGKGKPLRIEGGDPLYGVLKTANVKPAWLELQHEIRDALHALRDGMVSGMRVRPEEALHAINAKIARYNALVPHYSMQKSKIELESLAERMKAWE